MKLELGADWWDALFKIDGDRAGTGRAGGRTLPRVCEQAASGRASGIRKKVRRRPWVGRGASMSPRGPGEGMGLILGKEEAGLTPPCQSALASN